MNLMQLHDHNRYMITRYADYLIKEPVSEEEQSRIMGEIVKLHNQNRHIKLMPWAKVEKETITTTTKVESKINKNQKL